MYYVGAIEFLTDEDDEIAQVLRSHFIFKVVPMLNPDGVINGNYRCGLAGCDLNRRWKKPQQHLHPTIYHTKKLIKQFHIEKKLKLICDMHGHSKKKNIFMYGCHSEDDPHSTRIFPYMLSEMCPFFSFKSSKFGVQKSKESTARVSLWKDLQIPAIYTIEASFCGCDAIDYNDKHFTTDHLKQMGKCLCMTLLPYCNINPKPESSLRPQYPWKSEEENQAKEEADKNSSLFSNNLTSKNVKMKIGEITCEQASEKEESSGSDDNPSDDNIDCTVIKKFLPSKVLQIPSKQSEVESIYKQKENKSAAPYKKATIINFDKKPLRKVVTSSVTPLSSTKSKLKSESKLKPKQEYKIINIDKPKSHDRDNQEDTNPLNTGSLGINVATQTELIDFHRARMKLLMGKYGVHSSSGHKINKNELQIEPTATLSEQNTTTLQQMIQTNYNSKMSGYGLRSIEYSSEHSPKNDGALSIVSVYKSINSNYKMSSTIINSKIQNVTGIKNSFYNAQSRVQTTKGNRSSLINKMKSFDEVCEKKETIGLKRKLNSKQTLLNTKTVSAKH